MLTPTQVEKQYGMGEVFKGERFIFFKVSSDNPDKNVSGLVYRIVDGMTWFLSPDITQEMTNFIYERVGQKKQRSVTRRWGGKEFTSLGDPYTIDYPETTDEM